MNRYSNFLRTVLDETRYDVQFRLLGVLYGASILASELDFEDPLEWISGIFFGLMFWGILVNIIGYIFAVLIALKGFSKEQGYRILMLGHFPWVLAVLCNKNLDIIANEGLYFEVLLVISIINSIVLYQLCIKYLSTKEY